MMKEAVLFVHGRYLKRDFLFYRGLCRGRFKVAVDGGYRFFKAAEIVPDLLIGDFDSLRLPRNLPKAVKVVRHPVAKDKTDSHLALEYCLQRGVGAIDIVVPDFGQPDHFLGNIGLLDLAERIDPTAQVRIVNPTYQIVMVSDGRVEFSKCVGDTISIMARSRSITLDCEGMAFGVHRARIKAGETRALRNLVTRANASLDIKGKALLVHQFGGN